MKRITFCLVFISIFLTFGLIASGQAYYCKQSVLSSRRNIPKLKYKCRETDNDYDDAILKFPERISAIRKFETSLNGLSDPAWWAASVDDLAYCDIHKKAGRLTKEEIGSLKGGEYFYSLFGNHQIRVVKVPDPCYQTGYGGSDIFLLNRSQGKVYKAEIIDGFYSRADNAIEVNFASLGSEKLIEIVTGTGGLHPMMINYYFAIDPRTNRAVPKKLFKGEKGATNQITSMMLLSDAEDNGLPPKTEPLVVFKNGRLARSVIVIDDNGKTAGDDKHPVFEKTTLRWNGKYFQ